MIGWLLLAGAVALVACMTVFWDEVANWLNNNAANAVESAFGYDARQFMQRAVSTVTMVRDNLINRTIVYTKKNKLDDVIQKITLKSVAPTYTQNRDVIHEFEKQNEQVQTFEYKG